jgi:hypothetical protein
MTTDTAIEIVSPLAYRDITHICRVARNVDAATCSGCGETVYQRIHLPLIAHGLYCGRCCPCTTFVATPEELEAMERNRAQSNAEAVRAVKPKPVKPVEHLSPEERRARMREKLADAMKRRWADKAQRDAFVEARRKQWKPAVEQKPVVKRKRTIAPCLLAAGISPFWKP